jgi:hypothetical protein
MVGNVLFTSTTLEGGYWPEELRDEESKSASKTLSEKPTLQSQEKGGPPKPAPASF